MAFRELQRDILMQKWKQRHFTQLNIENSLVELLAKLLSRPFFRMPFITFLLRPSSILKSILPEAEYKKRFGLVVPIQQFPQLNDLFIKLFIVFFLLVI